MDPNGGQENRNFEEMGKLGETLHAEHEGLVGLVGQMRAIEERITTIQERITAIFATIENIRRLSTPMIENVTHSPTTAAPTKPNTTRAEGPLTREKASELVSLEAVRQYIDALAAVEIRKRRVSAEWPKEGKITLQKGYGNFHVVRDFPTGICVADNGPNPQYCAWKDSFRKLDGRSGRGELHAIPLSNANASYFDFSSLKELLENVLLQIDGIRTSDTQGSQNKLKIVAMDFLLATKILLEAFPEGISARSPIRKPQVHMPDGRNIDIDAIHSVHHALGTGIIEHSLENTLLLASAETPARTELLSLMLKEPLPQCFGNILSDSDSHELKNLPAEQRAYVLKFVYRLLGSGYLTTAKEFADAIGESIDMSHISAATVMDCLKSAPCVLFEQIESEIQHVIDVGTSEELLELGRFLVAKQLCNSSKKKIIGEMSARMNHEDGNTFLSLLLPQQNESPTSLCLVCWDRVHGGVSETNRNMLASHRDAVRNPEIILRIEGLKAVDRFALAQFANEMPNKALQACELIQGTLSTELQAALLQRGLRNLDNERYHDAYRYLQLVSPLPSDVYQRIFSIDYAGILKDKNDDDVLSLATLLNPDDLRQLAPSLPNVLSRKFPPLSGSWNLYSALVNLGVINPDTKKDHPHSP